MFVFVIDVCVLWCTYFVYYLLFDFGLLVSLVFVSVLWLQVVAFILGFDGWID